MSVEEDRGGLDPAVLATVHGHGAAAGDLDLAGAIVAEKGVIKGLYLGPTGPIIHVLASSALPFHASSSWDKRPIILPKRLTATRPWHERFVMFGFSQPVGL